MYQPGTIMLIIYEAISVKKSNWLDSFQNILSTILIDYILLKTNNHFKQLSIDSVLCCFSQSIR